MRGLKIVNQEEGYVVSIIKNVKQKSSYHLAISEHT